MYSAENIILSPTMINDLDFVIETENLKTNAEFIGQWSEQEHIDTIQRVDRTHDIIETTSGEKLGYIISYDLTSKNCGVYIKRIALKNKSKGIGRIAIKAFLEKAFSQQAAYVWLCVYPFNLRGQKCYSSVGLSKFDLTSNQLNFHYQTAENSSQKDVVFMGIYSCSHKSA